MIVPRLGQYQSVFRAFLAWWLGELKAMIPARVRRAFGTERRVLLLDLSEEDVVVRQCAGDSSRELGRLEASALDAPGQADAIQRLLGRARPRRQDIALRLPQSLALCASFQLPAIAEGDLRDVLRHQVDRHTPFSPDDSYFGYRIAGRHPETRALDIELTVVPRGPVDRQIRRAAAWGVEPVIVDIAHGDHHGGPVANLLEGRRPRHGGRRWSKANGLLALVAAGLVAAAVILPLNDRRLLAEDLASRVAEARRQSGEVIALRDRVEALMAEARFLVGRRDGSPRAVAVLVDLTDLLPDDTWIERFDMAGLTVRISGYSPAASSLIEIIDRSPMFQAPKFQSPVVRPAGSDRERFDLSFELELRPAEVQS